MSLNHLITDESHPQAYRLIVAVYNQYKAMYEAHGLPVPPMPEALIDGEKTFTRSAGAISDGTFRIQSRILEALEKGTDGFTPDMFKGAVAHEMRHIFGKHINHSVYRQAADIASNIITLGKSDATELSIPNECEAYHAMSYFGYGEAELKRPALGAPKNTKILTHPNKEELKNLFGNSALKQIPPGFVSFKRPDWGVFSDHTTACEIEDISPRYKYLEEQARKNEK